MPGTHIYSQNEMDLIHRMKSMPGRELTVEEMDMIGEAWDAQAKQKIRAMLDEPEEDRVSRADVIRIGLRASLDLIDAMEKEAEYAAGLVEHAEHRLAETQRMLRSAVRRMYRMLLEDACLTKDEALMELGEYREFLDPTGSE